LQSRIEDTKHEMMARKACMSELRERMDSIRSDLSAAARSWGLLTGA